MKSTVVPIVDFVHHLQNCLQPQDLVSNVNFQKNILLVLKNGCLETRYHFQAATKQHKWQSLTQHRIVINAQSTTKVTSGRHKRQYIIFSFFLRSSMRVSVLQMHAVYFHVFTMMNPPNSDIDHRIFHVRTFLCVYTRGVWGTSTSQHIILTRKNSFFLCSGRDSNLWSWNPLDLEVNALPIEPSRPSII